MIIVNPTTVITTIACEVRDVLLKEKGSKFLGYAFPVRDENDVQKYLEEIWEKHPKATHHCYAYRLGIDGKKYRANDDGEPSGSAGLPIYNQLLAHGITNVLLVVVRYYGGTKLGVSGLVKIYKESAKETLASVEIVSEEICERMTTTFPFEVQNLVFTILNKHQAKNIEVDFEEKCKLTAVVPLSRKMEIIKALSEIHTLDFEFL